MPRRPTLKDVAERAGVSVSAVSYALNDRSTVPLAEGTKQRIRDAAEELGYIPNRVARSLQARSSRAIGVILDKPLTVPRYAGIVQGLGAGLRAHQHHLTLLGDTAVAEAIDEARGGMIAGLVFIGHDDQSAPAELIDQVRRHGIPFATLDCGDADAPYPSVDFDYAEGVRQALAHVLSRGATQLLYVRPDLDSRAEIQRERALAEELDRRADIALTVVSDGITAERLGGYDAVPADHAAYATALADQVEGALRALSAAPAQAAVLCAWGTDAETVYRAARRVSDDIHVASLAAGSLALELWHNLSYSRLPLEEAGRACADLIVAETTRGGGAEHRVLAPTLDVSASPSATITTGGRS